MERKEAPRMKTLETGGEKPPHFRQELSWLLGPGLTRRADRKKEWKMGSSFILATRPLQYPFTGTAEFLSLRSSATKYIFRMIYGF